MIRTAWDLGARRDLADLKLRSWVHMLGFRGHFSTKTRQYSTTLAELGQARADYQYARAGASPTGPDAESTLALAHWAFSGIGLTPEPARLAAALAPPPTPPPSSTAVTTPAATSTPAPPASPHHVPRRNPNPPRQGPKAAADPSRSRPGCARATPGRRPGR